MPSAALDAFLMELRSFKAQWEPELEGFRDFADLNIQEATRQVVQATIARYERRLAYVEAELRRIGDLQTDGYPDMPTLPVDSDVYADLSAQLATQNAAYAKVTPQQEAVTGRIIPGGMEDVSAGAT